MYAPSPQPLNFDVSFNSGRAIEKICASYLSLLTTRNLAFGEKLMENISAGSLPRRNSCSCFPLPVEGDASKMRIRVPLSELVARYCPSLLNVTQRKLPSCAANSVERVGLNHCNLTRPFWSSGVATVNVWRSVPLSAQVPAKNRMRENCGRHRGHCPTSGIGECFVFHEK